MRSTISAQFMFDLSILRSMEKAIQRLVDNVDARFRQTKEGSAFQHLTDASAYLESVEFEEALAKFNDNEMPHAVKKPK